MEKARTLVFIYVGSHAVIEWIWLQTWTRVIIDVDRLVRLSLKIYGSWQAEYIKPGLPGPGHITCSHAVTLSPALGADLLGCITPYKSRNGKKWKESNQTTVPGTQSYELISPTTDQYRAGWPFSESGARGKSTSSRLTWKVVKTHADAICTGLISKEEKKRRQIQEIIQTWSHLDISTSTVNPYSSDHQFP